MAPAPVPGEARHWAWQGVPPPQFVGGHALRLLQGGDELFPAMLQAIDAASSQVWLATYIFHEDPAAQRMAEALIAAARRGVAVHVVVDGFGSMSTLPTLRRWFAGTSVALEVFRPLDRWYSWLQPGQLRRLHQKLCAVDEAVAYVGGINVIDDRHDLNHGWTELPRLDFAVELRGALAASVRAAARAMWARAHLGHVWSEELLELARRAEAVEETRWLLRRLKRRALPMRAAEGIVPVRAAFVVRDNLLQRRAIERSYVLAIRQATECVDIAASYFYPGRVFRRVLRQAARRGVRVRLLLQGKIDYRIAGWAQRALYDELRAHGVTIYEYTPAFLHAKVAVVDGRWATVGSSNIDPLSLLLNLEANVVVDDTGFSATVAQALDRAIAASTEVHARSLQRGWRALLQRGVVAWVANVYLRLAGITGRY